MKKAKKKKSNRSFLERLFKTLSNKDIVYMLIGALLTVIGLTIYLSIRSMKISDLFEVKTFFAIVSAFVLNYIVLRVTRIFQRKLEDSNKLEENYDKLVKNYSRCKTFLQIENNFASEVNRAKGKNTTKCKAKNDCYTLPVFDKIKIRGKDIIINDSERMYEPLPYVNDNLKEFSNIYSFTNKYNRTNIRLDGVENKGKSIIFHTSRTKYYYSLITNRALDYKIKGLSYRELFEEGPFPKSLEDSTLSNHLGYNGYVQTKDNDLIFILRHGDVSIGKNTLQNSVGASLKAEFALSDDKLLTKEGIAVAMREEIKDELRLRELDKFNERENEIFKDFSFSENVIYFYRDLVEGGKPQLFFYAKLPISTEELKRVYTKDISKEVKCDKSGLYASVDGYKMLFVSRNKIKDIYIAPDAFVIEGKAYKAMPSAVASFQMLKDYLGEDNDN